MTALLLALGASLTWGVADFVGPWLGRTWGTLRIMLWGQCSGLLFVTVVVAIHGGDPRSGAIGWAVLAALSATIGLVGYYQGIATGTISVVAPIAGASAIVPVIYGIARGDDPSVGQLVGIGAAIVGVAFASMEQQDGKRAAAAGVGLAVLAAVGFGFYFPPMHAAGAADPWWGALLFRFASVGFVSVAVAARRPTLRLPRRVVWIVALVGVGDTLGNILFAAAAGRGLVSLTSVMASLYPVITVGLAAVFLHERISRMQQGGVVLTLVGIGLIST